MSSFASRHPSHPGRNLATLICRALLAAAVAGAAVPANGQATASRPAAEIALPPKDTDVLEGRSILRVEVAGNTRTPTEAIMAVVRVQGGQLYNRAQLEVDVRNLAALQKFSSVRGDVVATADGKVVIRFVVEERPTINAVEIVGNRNVSSETLRDLVVTRAGDTYQPFLVEQDRQAIINAYKKEAYSTVRVEVDEDTWKKRGILRYVITEGPKVYIDNVYFQGNKHLTDDFLKWKITTKPYFFFFQKGIVDENALDADVAIIQEQYRRRGYIDVRVGRSLEYSADKRRVAVRFVIDEGQRYRVGKINLSGNKVFANEELMGQMTIQPGQYVDRDQIERSQRHIEDLYGRQGYIYRKLDITTSFTETPGMVDLNFRVEENRAYTVGQVIIRGNQNVQDRVIRRHIRIYPDQTFDMVMVKKSTDRLKAQGIYRDVRITPVSSPDRDTADALVEVQEGQTGKYTVGAGLSSNSGLIGQISLEQKNFDIANWPTSWDEFWRGQAFKGAGQYFQILLEPGTQLQRYRVRFEEPSIFDTAYSFGNDLYYFTRQRENHDEQRIGDIVTLGRRFGDVWAVSLAFRAEQVEISSVQDVNNDRVSESGYFLLTRTGRVIGPYADTAQEILDEQGNHMLTSIKPAILRDTTDSRVFPTEGTRSSLGWEQYGAMGGEVTMSKIVGRFDWYYTLHQDIFDRKTVFVQRNEVGVIPFGESVFYERFYGGGTGGLRGFRFRGVSPRQGGLKDPIGGDFSWFSSAEVNFPLFEEILRGVVFIDVGTVERDITVNTIRADAGFGVRVKIPFFGDVPLALDFAVPVMKADGDETQLLSFSMGIPY